MVKRKRVSAPKNEKRKKIGLYLLQVVKATNDGALPISQKEVIKLLKSTHRISIPSSSSSEFVSILVSDELGRIWLKQDGHTISLFSEEETLADSRLIKALFLAHSLIDENDCVSATAWSDHCVKKLKVSQDDCKAFLKEFAVCNYVDLTHINTDIIKLDVRAFGEDGFYLEVARNAYLTKRVSRRKKTSLN